VITPPRVCAGVVHLGTWANARRCSLQNPSRHAFCAQLDLCMQRSARRVCPSLALASAVIGSATHAAGQVSGLEKGLVPTRVCTFRAEAVGKNSRQGKGEVGVQKTYATALFFVEAI
jgi:hypothetical protein